MVLSRKNVRYSNHAIKRKLERDISDEEIRKTLNEPDYILSSSEGREIATKRVENRTIHVVYKEEKSHINIITVY